MTIQYRVYNLFLDKKLCDSPRLKALDAAEKVNGYPLLPHFEKISKGTDWNDLTQEIGKEAVQRSLNHGLAVIEKKVEQKMDLNKERMQVQTREVPDPAQEPYPGKR